MRVGSGIRTHPRLFTFTSLEGKAYKGVFIEKFPKRQDPSTMISHIKNISVGLWLHKRETHIQYPNMYKLYVSCNYIQGLFVAAATQTPAQCRGRSGNASA